MSLTTVMGDGRSVVAALLVVTLATGCCDASTDAYGIGLLTVGAPDYAVEPVRWNTRVEVGPESGAPIRGVRVWAARIAIREGQELVEFRDGEGEALRVESTFHSVPAADPDSVCAFDAVDYDLTSLPPGEYVMIHRASDGPADLRYDERVAWMPFEGELALTATIVLF